ncbi:MAG: LysM peptidoglycan-binding domain-containing protein [Ardenticatenaceae bacterium]|nr:LysM peptidoglycan-binding domain-containing protein [Ardenticatenaceae bacterium]
MRKIIIAVLFLLLLLAACSDDGPSALPGFNDDGNGENDSAVASENVPRAEAPTPTMLPPTFTPAPMDHEGHLYLVGNYSGTRIIHIVQPGDTLAKLCDRYGVPISDLARINNIRNINHIEVGDSLIIPLPREDS